MQLKKPLLINLALLLIALIWGFGFIPQRLGMAYLEPAAFNALRFALGAITLLPILLFSRSITARLLKDKSTLKLGVILGALLFGGAIFQQLSVLHTSLANVAFITGLYVIVVPIIGFFIGYKYKLIVWLGGGIAIVGLYLMTVASASANASLKGDFLALIGAVFWAVHLLALAKQADRHNQLLLAFYQFMFCAIFSALASLGFEDRLLPLLIEGYIWPLINGVIVVGFAYTLQVIVMPHAEPFAASLIFSLEAVFGAMAGYFVFSEQLGLAAIVGAIMIMLGCILAQQQSTNTHS